MAKVVNECNKKSEEGKSVKEKEPVLFEELVRTIYGRLHYKDDEPIGDDDDNASGNKQTSVPDERSFSCNEFSRVFLTADGKTASESAAPQMLSSKVRKSFGESTFYSRLKNPETRTDYLEGVKNFLETQISEKASTVKYDVGKTIYEDMNAIYSKGYKNTLEAIFSRIYDFDRNGYIECICEMLSNALMFHLLGDEKVSLIRKANLREDNITGFIGRNDELSWINDKLNNDRIAVISGEPGIGKTEVIYKFALDHRELYNKIVFVRYNTSIEKSINDIIEYKDVSFRTFDTIRALSVKKNTSKSTLVIIENADKSTFDSNYMELLKEGNFDVIIESRYKVDYAIEIGPMDINDIRDLVKSQTADEKKQEELLNSNNLNNIMQTANYNTMHIVLLTRAIVKSDHHLDSIFTQQGIQCLNELYAKQSIEFKQRSIRKNEVRKELLTINQHLQLLYSDYTLPEEILKLLCFISYMLPSQCYLTVKQIKRLFPGVSDIMIQEMTRHHAVVLLNNEYQEEYLFFSHSILLFLFKRRNEYKTTDYLSAMSDVYTYIAGYNAFDNCNNLALIFNLECNFVFDDMEALAFRWELLYFLESQYPNNACLKSIRETLEKNPESVKITDTAEKNNNAYIFLLLQSNDQEAYKNLVERNFKIKTIYDSFLIKSWLTQADINYSAVSEISNMRHDKETPVKSNIINNLVSIIQSYSSAGNINKNVLGQPDVTNFVIIESMLSELQAGTLESTHMHSVMKQHLSEDELETLPDIFIDLKLYKKVIYYSAVFYISALFFNTDIQNTDYLCALSQIMDDLVHNYTIYSDDNRLMLLYQLANQQLLAGKIDEAQKTVEEAENFKKLVYDHVYILKAINVKTRYLTRKHFLDEIANIQKDHAVSEDDLYKIFNESMMNFAFDLAADMNKDCLGIMNIERFLRGVSMSALIDQFQREKYVRGFIDSKELYPTLFPKTSTAAFPFHNYDEMYAILKEKLDSIKEFYESQIPLYKPDNKEEPSE